MKASLCPVCNGKGLVYGVAETGASPTTTCHGCGGRGWVEVNDNPSPSIDPTRCLSCGGDRSNPPGTGCPKGSHYGTYS